MIYYKMTFMFELLANGTVTKLAKILKEHNIKFGFGGFARIGYGILPAEKILTQHYALGSQMAILSRGFCDANRVEDPETTRTDFIEGIRNIRLKEEEIIQYTFIIITMISKKNFVSSWCVSAISLYSAVAHKNC